MSHEKLQTVWRVKEVYYEICASREYGNSVANVYGIG